MQDLPYHFNDEHINRWDFDGSSRRLIIEFVGFYDLEKDRYEYGNCRWTISKWQKLSGAMSMEIELFEDFQIPGIPRSIDQPRMVNGNLEMFIQVEDEWLRIQFVCPVLELVRI